MLKMIIADDETIVRDGLRNIVKWHEFGIEIAGEAVDGEEAFELCRNLQPDILFTDIRMPVMDGLEVAMKLKEENSNIKVIIISGVQDFNYAKTALDINVEGYILKPVKINELHDVINRVTNCIALEKNREQEMALLKQQLSASIPAIRENFLRNLISGMYRDESGMDEKLEYLKIPFKAHESAVAAVIRIDKSDSAIENTPEESRQLLSLSVFSVAERIIQNCNLGVCLTLSEREFAVIFNQYAHAGKKYMDVCEEIMSCVRKFLNVTVSIGVGRSVNSFSHMDSSYKEAVEALEYRFYTGNNSLLGIDDICLNTKDADCPNLYEVENRLMNYMRLGDAESVLKTVDEIFIMMYPARILQHGYVQNVCVEMICTASRVIYENGGDIEHISDSRSVLIENILKKQSMTALKDYMMAIFLQLTEYFTMKYRQKNTGIIEKIKGIINKKYMNGISVSKIAEEVYLTPNYISLIFKKETGETITEYITKVRIAAAKDLLKSTDWKVLEIAEMVGYENPQYFSTVFKKYAGIHPGQYRSCNSGCK